MEDHWAGLEEKGRGMLRGAVARVGVGVGSWARVWVVRRESKGRRSFIFVDEIERYWKMWVEIFER